MKKNEKNILIPLTVICLLLTTNCFAKLSGQALMDSLLTELPKQKEDTNKVNLLNAISFDYWSINPDDGIKYGQQGLELSTKLQWKKGMAGAYNTLGVNYMFKSDQPKALAYYTAALKINEEIGDKQGVARNTGNIGNIYSDEGDYTHALEYYFKSIKMAEEIGNKQSPANTMGSIGNVYKEQGNYPRALEYYFKALKMQDEIGNKQSAAITTGNIGNVYREQGDYPRALESYFKALKMHEDMGEKSGVARNTGNIGLVYDVQGDYPRALEYYLKALKMDEEMGDNVGVAINTGNIGEVYTKQKEYIMAIAYGKKALELDEEIGSKRPAAYALEYIGNAYLALSEDSVKLSKLTLPSELPAAVSVAPSFLNGPSPSDRVIQAGRLASIPAGKAAQLSIAVDYLRRGLDSAKKINVLEVEKGCYEGLAHAYKTEGDYKKAMEYNDDYAVIKDSIYSLENAKKIYNMEMQQQEESDSLKSLAEKHLADIKYQHQRNYTYLGIAATLVLMVFSFFIVKERGKSEKERKTSDGLLLNILPSEVAQELKKTGASTAKQFENVTVLFTDFVGFTRAGERMTPQALVEELNTCFKKFDEITARHHIEKIKTIGDGYLAVAGLPIADPNHAEHIVSAAREIRDFIVTRHDRLGDRTFQLRIGVHSGDVVAGIIGAKKFAYDIWGDTVNTAARMEQNSEPGKINISEATYELVKDKFHCEFRGEIDAKGKGEIKMYFVS